MGRPCLNGKPTVLRPDLPCADCGVNQRETQSWCYACSVVRRREYVQNVKLETMTHYGGKCNCCGESELVFLCIDHIKDDAGNRLGTKGGYSFYLKLKKLNYPEGYQVLCANCNLGKASHSGICPHQAMS